MAECDDMHKAFGPLAGGAIQVGELPDWTRIRGRVAWYVYRGPYSEISAKV